MTNHSDDVCATTCCGQRTPQSAIKPACFPRHGPVEPPVREKAEKIKCYEEDLVSLPNLHDIYCMKKRNKKAPIPPNTGTPRISDANQKILKDKEEDVYEVFRHMLQLYQTDEIMFAFNGGKDCTVVLDMLCRFYRMVCLSNEVLPVLYIYNDDSFDEVNEFVDQCAKRYNIELFKYKGDMKTCLAQLLREYRSVKTFRTIKACVMGLRRSDPYCNNLKVIQFTDPDWPPLMRINPILEWTYCDVWNYILHYNVPYCPLYDEGYTSLGNKSNTIRNDLLKCKQATCKTAYYPAYELIDGSMERAGRIPLSVGGFKQPQEAPPASEQTS